jgi:hypothetical protein
MDQVKSEQYLIQHFDNVKQVRKQISHIRYCMSRKCLYLLEVCVSFMYRDRILIQKIADEIEDVENIVTYVSLQISYPFFVYL